MKKWSVREVILILDFIGFIRNYESQYRDAFITFYYQELQRALPEFSNVSFDNFSTLINGLSEECLSPYDIFPNHRNCVDTFQNEKSNRFIVKYASDYRKTLNITDCKTALLSSGFGASHSFSEGNANSISESKENEHSINVTDSTDVCLKSISVEQEDKNEERTLKTEENIDEDEVEENYTHFEELIREYLSNKQYFNNITFADKLHPKSTTIPMIFSATLYLIDKQLERGNKRITIVMPAECNLMPLFTTRVVRDEMEGPYDPFENLRGVQPGQKMRIGKAIIEIIAINKDDFQYRCKDINKCTEIRSANKTWYQYLEKVEEGSLNKYKLVKSEISRIEKQASANPTLQVLLSNKGAVSKTTVLLTTKTSVDEFSKEYSVLGSTFSKVLSAGEFCTDPIGFISGRTFGRMPNFTVSTELAQVVTCVSNESIRNNVDCIFVTQEKVRELLANKHTLERLLKLSIPTIVFLSENDYERYKELERYDFTLFHWKPSTLTDASFTKNITKYTDTVFEGLARKTKNASKASFNVFECNGNELDDVYRKLKKLTNSCEDFDNKFKDLLHKLWCVYKAMVSDCYSEKLDIYNNPLMSEISAAYETWNSQKDYYHEDIRNNVEALLEKSKDIITSSQSIKFQCLCDALKDQVAESKRIAVVVPDKCSYPKSIQNYLSSKYVNGNCVFKVLRLKEFLFASRDLDITYDYVNVLWFDRSDYINIKNTYSYLHLVYILFPFEEKWRAYFRKNFDECLQHKKTVNIARELGVGESIRRIPFDEPKGSNSIAFDDQAKYDFDSAVSKIYGESNEYHGDDDVPCCLIVSRDYKISFLPTHKVIDVTDILASGDRIQQKSVRELRHGDCFVVRKSNKDIVADVADIMIGKTASQFREEVGLWCTCLSILINDKGFDYVYDRLGKNDLCTKQQLRYWSMGETICPDNPKVCEIIARLCTRYTDDEEIMYFCRNYKSIYEKGKKLQRIHMIAGKVINQKLRKKQKEISDIYFKKGGQGTLAGIGDVVIIEVDAVYGNQTVNKAKLNRLEAI